MNIKTFRGRDLAHVFEQAMSALGDDAMIIATRELNEYGGVKVEVVAASGAEVERLKQRLQPTPLPSTGRRGPNRPFTMALVGPTGAGKTTTIAKLAVHPGAFGRRNVGLLTLDTYRVGAVEQLGTFAEIVGLPLEVVYSPGEVRDAVKRLSSCDVILVDTPGRSLRLSPAEVEWGGILAELAPDEVHLVMPATVRFDIADAVCRSFASYGTTHLLLSKIDEVPGEVGVAELASRLDLPSRWATDGQDVPADLRAASARILASMGHGSAGWAA